MSVDSRQVGQTFLSVLLEFFLIGFDKKGRPQKQGQALSLSSNRQILSSIPKIFLPCRLKKYSQPTLSTPLWEEKSGILTNKYRSLRQVLNRKGATSVSERFCTFFYKWSGQQGFFSGCRGAIPMRYTETNIQCIMIVKPLLFTHKSREIGMGATKCITLVVTMYLLFDDY